MRFGSEDWEFVEACASLVLLDSRVVSDREEKEDADEREHARERDRDMVVGREGS